MANIILDPERWESIEAGEACVLECWLVAEGDQGGDAVARARLVGEPVDILAPHDGVVEEILVPAGERFIAGHVLARVVEF